MALPAWVAAAACVEGAESRWSTAELTGRVDAYREAMLRAVPAGSSIGLLADNSPHWIAVDLAAQSAAMTLVPLPAFFTHEQIAHAARASGMHALFCADAVEAASFGFVEEVFAADGLRLFRCGALSAKADMPHARKITFTSGTTGTPRGVVLSVEHQLLTARALVSATAHVGIARHLCVLPLPVLLENVAGACTALAMGATCICPALRDLGVSGASGFDAERFLDAVARYRPDSVILLPEMVRALVARLSARRSDDPRVRPLKFVAVGGAKTPPAVIVRARELGLPVFEGYGLTECASVVSLNVPGADRVGTVGRALPGLSVRKAADGELEIRGRPGIAYLDAPAHAHGSWLRTGDIGEIDGEGYVSITGRRKNVIVTSFGRNVSPEWPESLLLESALLAQAAVFGEGRPALAAVLVPASPQVEDAALGALVAQVNARLPDYARIRGWVRASEPFTPRGGLATPNGRVKREAAASRYASELAGLYESTTILP
jgi:long-subunit acyl-CoA synthetase (AMP-forming)